MASTNQQPEVIDNDYVSRSGHKGEPVPVQSDNTKVQDPIDGKTANSDEQLGMNLSHPPYGPEVLTMQTKFVTTRTQSINPISSKVDVRGKHRPRAHIRSLVMRRVFQDQMMERVPVRSRVIYTRS